MANLSCTFPPSLPPSYLTRNAHNRAPQKNNKLCSDDDWVVIRTERQTAVHLIAARGALEELLYQKIAKPNLNISQEPIITEIVHLIERY